jgi:hypothetical protein
LKELGPKNLNWILAQSSHRREYRKPNAVAHNQAQMKSSPVVTSNDEEDAAPTNRPVVFRHIESVLLPNLTVALMADPQKYVATTAIDTNLAGPISTARSALASDKSYVQWGLSARDPEPNLVAKAALSLGVLLETSHSVAAVDEKMHACVAVVHGPLYEYFMAMQKYMAHKNGFRVTHKNRFWVTHKNRFWVAHKKSVLGHS